jgi:hypothetical protein
MDKDKDKDNNKYKDKDKDKINPSFNEIDSYGKERGYNLPIQKIIDHYTNGGELNYWIDRDNKKVKRWKSKISSVWFKDEYLIKKKNVFVIDTRERS